MYRPNEIEEKRLLELTEWIEEAKKENRYVEYVMKEITNRVDLSWEDIDYRQKLCTKDLEETKQSLLDEYYEFGQFSELLKQKIENIKEDVCPEVYDYFSKLPQTFFVSTHLLRKKYQTILMMESGWLPNLKGMLNVSLEEEANEIQKSALDINKQYKTLILWIDSLIPNDIIDDKGINYIKTRKSNYVSELFLARRKEKPLKYVQDKIIQRNSIVDREKFGFIDNIDWDKIVNEKESRPDDAAIFYPNQEIFYEKLETWTESILNPYCRKWIKEYLEHGRNLPFYKIRVFKYIKDIIKAKEFLLEQYERKLEKKHIKEQERKHKNDKYSGRRYKSDLCFYKKTLRESGESDFTKEDEKKNYHSSNKVVDYPLGYAGTWAHDEAGYSDGDIDTIFDGDPDAYWNFD